MSYRSTSYWFDSIGFEPEARAPLPGDRDVDIVILGAGFSGLWTAYYLSIADPGCQIAVIERDIAGFGAQRWVVLARSRGYEDLPRGRSD